MIWHYNGKEITEVSHFPKNTHGFVYKIEHLPSGKSQIRIYWNYLIKNP